MGDWEGGGRFGGGGGGKFRLESRMKLRSLNLASPGPVPADSFSGQAPQMHFGETLRFQKKENEGGT